VWIKFTEEGRVALRVEYRTEGLSSRLFFEVEDTGPGIDPREMERLFEAFVQTTAGQQVQEGTGLGLPISQQFVQFMGGELSVRSEVGKGSVFLFDLSIKLADALEVEVHPVRRVVGLEADQPVYRILIVEDKLDSRRLLAKLLEPLGFEVREAEDGQQGLDIWQVWGNHI
jgi:hypothetical protein